MVKRHLFLCVLLILFYVGFVNAISESDSYGTGSGSVPVENFELNDVGINYVLTPTRLIFNFENDYALQLRKITDDEAVFLVLKLGEDDDDISDFSYEGIYVLGAEDERNIDVNEDDIADIYLRLNDIEKNDAGRKTADFFVRWVEEGAEVSLKDINRIRDFFDEEELEELEKVFGSGSRKVKEIEYKEIEEMEIEDGEVGEVEEIAEEDNGTKELTVENLGNKSFDGESESNRSLIEIITDLIWLIFGDKNGRGG